MCSLFCFRRCLLILSSLNSIQGSCHIRLAIFAKELINMTSSKMVESETEKKIKILNTKKEINHHSRTTGIRLDYYVGLTIMKEMNYKSYLLKQN